MAAATGLERLLPGQFVFCEFIDFLLCQMSQYNGCSHLLHAVYGF
jgi:hypothetical protein